MRTYSRKNSSYLKKAFIASNFNEMCRLCLSEMDLGLTPIIQDSHKVCYQEWIEYGVDIQVEEGDGLPPNICEECLALVEQTYLFKKKCKASDNKLREHLELMELSDEHRLHEMGFSDLEEDSNLFRRNEATQSNGDESNVINSGGTVQDAENNGITDDMDVDMMVDEVDDEGDEDECTFKDVTHIQEDKKPNENIHIINGKKTKDTEQQTENIPRPVEKRKRSEAKNIGYQGKVKRFILRGEKRMTDDDDEEDLSVFEVVPVEKNDDSVEVLENSEENNACSCSMTQAKNSQTMLKEIYDQWECDDSLQGDVVTSTNANANANAKAKAKSNTNGNANAKANTNPNAIAKSNTNGNANAKPNTNPNAIARASRSTATTTNVINEGDQALLHNVQVQNVHFENGRDQVQVNRIYQSRSKIEIIETIPSTPRYSCCTCPQAFLTNAELKEHLTSVHEITEASSCEVCYKTFTCTNSLRRHMLIHTGFKPYKCRVCSREFSQTSTLKRHVLTHEESKPFVCYHCSKSYTQKVNLLSHLKTHGVQSDDLIYNCKACNKSFAHQSGLSRHVKEHRGYRFMCSHCKRSFVDPSALQRHVKRLHQKRSQKKTIMNLRSRNRR